MALGDLQRLVVYDTATQLWQQDLLMNAYFHGSSVGANLRSMILGRQPVQPLTNPFDEAITGQLRADSRTIRQNARNVREGAAMMGTAAQGVGAIKSFLEEMKALAKSVAEDQVDSEDVRDEYNALRSRIEGLVTSTKFNRIALLDGNQWGTSQIDADGKVFIQGFQNGGFDLTFRNLDQFGVLDGNKLEEEVDLQDQLDELSGLIGNMVTIGDIYTRRQEGLEFQAVALESQADLLDQAVEARRQVPTKSLEEILLDLLFRNSGRIVDATG
ncbi:hypothetical protein [Desulfonatronum thioautotrophicum]|uniref:flagellin N-terminal helical domain-containing protein n=1 Tax=Desulfonatronum thioautotrophicum TaxID=617001 RepID=UPI0005EB7F09|nr:hypothetical protein [Desulfonatronum thioautotrophicum]